MKGSSDTTLLAGVSRAAGKGDLGFGTGVPPPLPGVEGHEDRMRGVPFMA
jgi:hypothetical protein